MHLGEPDALADLGLGEVAGVAQREDGPLPLGQALREVAERRPHLGRLVAGIQRGGVVGRVVARSRPGASRSRESARMACRASCPVTTSSTEMHEDLRALLGGEAVACGALGAGDLLGELLAVAGHVHGPGPGGDPAWAARRTKAAKGEPREEVEAVGALLRPPG